MRIVFFGTPPYVIPVLDALQKEFKAKSGESPIVAVVTQPPQPVGRTKKLEYSAVDTWAHKKGVPTYFDSRELIGDGIQADIGIVAAYGAIIPKEVLEYYPYGLLNLHFSTLPEFRGASPVHAALITGQKEMGISIFKLDGALDHGPIVSQSKVDIDNEDTVETLRDKGFAKCAEVLETLLPAYMQGKIKLKIQDHSKATYARIIKKEDGFIPPEILQATLQGLPFKGRWKIFFIYTKDKEGNRIPYSLVPSAQCLESFIRTMNPWPGAWTTIKIKKANAKKQKEEMRLKILMAHTEKSSVTSHESLVLDEVQLEGKNPVSWKQFKEAYATAIFL